MPPATQIKKLDASISTFSRPFTRSGVLPNGIRMTSVKLRNDDIVLISPTPLDAQTEAELNGLGGKVKYLVCPNVVHHLSIDEYKRRWPQAKLIGVPGLPEKHPDLTFDGVVGVDDPRTAKYGFEDELKYRHFAGTRNQDTAYYHKDTKTLITADLLFNLPPTEQYPPGTKFGFFTRIAHSFLNPSTATHRFFTRHGLSKDSKQTREDARWVADNWQIERIAHGNVIESGADRAFQSAYAWAF